MPALLHFNEKGELVAPPFRLAGLSSEGNPFGEQATLPRSRGFEGMAISMDGDRLYPLLEGEVKGSGLGLNIYTFDLKHRRFVNNHARQPSLPLPAG